MAQLTMFMSISIDGYFADAKSDMSWAHIGGDDEEYQEFVAGNAEGGGQLMFGRVTYEMMASFWPTPEAMKQMPDVAGPMNDRPKIVFSRTLKEATWSNTRLISRNILGAVKAVKAEGPDTAILGSGMIVAQLAEAGLIDEYQIVTVPVVLGVGKPLFGGIGRRLSLELTDTRAFRNGKVVNCYRPRR